MVVQDAKLVTGLALSLIEMDEGKIKLVFKNGSTFSLTQVVEEGVVSRYDMNFINGKENKKIAKLQSKADELLSQIRTITEEGDSDNSKDEPGGEGEADNEEDKSGDEGGEDAHTGAAE